MTCLLELRGVQKSFANQVILENINLSLYKGGSLVILGFCGSGKSVLLKIMASLLVPDSGSVLYHGAKASLRNSALRTGFVFQNDALFDSLTIYDNVAFYLNYHSDMTALEIKLRVYESLERVHLENVAHLTPNQLSGGMRKRVGLARAIVHAPDILFLDEPSAGLDPITSDRVASLIVQLQQEYSLSVISVTSTLEYAKQAASHVAVIHCGQVYTHLANSEFFQTKDPFILEHFFEQNL